MLKNIFKYPWNEIKYDVLMILKNKEPDIILNGVCFEIEGHCVYTKEDHEETIRIYPLERIEFIVIEPKKNIPGKIIEPSYE